MDMPAHVKAGLEIGSVLTVLGALAGYLPAISAGLAVAWYVYLFVKEYRNRKND